MKVVHLSTSDLGGAGMACRRLHLSLLNAGIQSHLLTLYKFTTDVPYHSRYQASEGAGIPFLAKGIDTVRKALKYSGILPPRYVRMANKHLKNRPVGFENFSFAVSPYHLQNHPLVRDADIVHLHWVSEGYLDFNSFFPGMKHKLVWTLHDMNPFTGGCHHSDECQKFQNDCALCPQLKNTVDENFGCVMLKDKIKSLKNIPNNQLHIVSPSRWLGNLSIKSRLFERFNHSVIPNPLDPKVFYPQEKSGIRNELGLPNDKKIILFISHHIDNQRKGLKNLLNALQTLNREDVLVCSAGNELKEEELSGIRHLGYIRNEIEMAKVYSAADLFVLPSQAENLPNTICESLFCGTPVVAFDIGGIPELLVPSNGKLAEPGRTESLADAIQYVLDHPENYDRNEISKSINKLMADTVVADKYIRVYNQIYTE